MTFQGVPLAIDGADNPVETVRLLAYVAARTSHGVVLPADCQLRAMPAPDGRARITPGALVVRNGAVGVGAEAYLARNPDDHVLPAFTPTGVGQTRSDFVYLRVADPQFGGQPTPADRDNGPYDWPEVVAGVAPTTKTLDDVIAQGLLPIGTTGEPIGRVDFPQSTATVSQSMITDLRQLAVPRSERRQIITTGATSSLTSSNFVVFPGNGSWAQAIPEWATHAVIRVDALGLAWDGALLGDLRVVLDGVPGPNIPYNISDPVAGADRLNLIAAGEVAIAAASRGTTKNLILQGRRTSGTTSINSSNAVVLLVDVTYVERLESA